MPTQPSKPQGRCLHTCRRKSSLRDDKATQLYYYMNLSKEIDWVLHDFTVEVMGKFGKVHNHQEYMEEKI